MSTDPVPLGRGSISQAMRLSAEAGWNQVEADWGVFMDHGKVYGFTEQGRLVATAAALPYGPDLGWISMVLVTQARRGRGLATRLVAACVALLRDAGRTAFLDATPAGAPVYARLGFVPLCGMQRWSNAAPPPAAPTPSLPAASRGEAIQSNPANLPAGDTSPALAQDHAAFGADRAFLLRDILARPGSLAFTERGLALLRPGSRAMQLGPIIATPANAPALASAAIAAATGPVFVDVLDAGACLLPALAAHGFTEQRRFTRMALGHAALPGDPARLLAAAGPEYG